MCAQATAAHGHLVIQMLGPPAIVWEGQSFPIARRQVRALLYRLAADRHFVARDALCALFWPDAPTDVAQANLSRLVYLLKQALPDPELLLRREEQIGFDPERTWADTCALAAVLDRPLVEPAALRAAAALYRGPFLDGFSCPDAAEFDLWITRQRHAWEQRYLALLGRLLDLEEQQGDLAAAVRWARRYLEIDELAEPIHRRLILLYAALGDREAAAQQFERCVVALERELGVAPLPETRAAYEAALSGRRSRPTRRSVPAWHLWPTMAAPFVGREAALEQLRRAYAHARGGRGAAMFIAGEAGIGKTRLLQEFTASLPADAPILAVAGREMAQDVPYLALAEGLRRVLPAVDWAGLPVSRGLLAELTVILPDLRDRCPGLPARQDAPAAGPTRLFLALDDLLAALAHAQPPLVFCLDDLHLLDESTRGWLTGWLAGLRHLPALFLATYRPEEAAAAAPLQRAAAHGCPVTELALAGLERAAVREIVRYALGEAAHDPALDEHLHQLTGSNPFFLLELLRHLAENPAPAAAAPDELSFPATIQDAVRRRLDRLPAAARHALEAASVLGTPFSPEVLAATAACAEEEVIPALELLAAQGLIVERGREYGFAHDLVRELVYRGMPYHRRRLLHRRAAQALRRLAPVELAAIARHLQQADDPKEAADWWLRAGDAARRMYACGEAVRCYERALALQRTAADDEAAARTLMRLGLTHHIAFDFDRAAQAYAQGFTLRRQTARQAARPAAGSQVLRVDWPALSTLDPALAQNANSGGVIEQLFSGLATWDPDLNVIPDAAREWEVQDEGRRYIFYLKEDGRWSDGQPLRAQDFIVAWRRILHPRSTSPFVRLLFPIRHAAAYHQSRLDDPAVPAVQAADDLTLVVELEHPCSFFPHLIAHPVARPVPAHRLETAGEGWWKPDLLVTNGPFRLREWIPDVRAALARSPTYRGDWPGNAEEVVLYLGLDRERKQVKWRRYQEGGLDVFTLRWGLAPEEMARIRQEGAGELVSAANFFVRFLGFDTRRTPFADARVRHAFAHAVDRRSVIHLLGGDLAPACGGMIPPGMPGHTAELAPGYDPLQAQSLLAAAGYPDGRGFPPVRLLAFPGAEAAAEYLQLAWRRILRVEVGLEALPWEAYQQRLRCGPWPDLFLAGWVADYPDPDSLLRVCAIQERTGWHNAAYLALLEQAARSRDPEGRLRLYRQADALLMHDLPIFPLAYSCWSLLLKPRVRHFPLSPLKWWYWTEVVLEAM